MSMSKLVIGLVISGLFLSFVVFPGYAQSQGKANSGGNFQGRGDDVSKEMLRLRDKERKQIREGSEELGKEVQKSKQERKEVMEKKTLEERERVQMQEQEQKQKEKMFQQFERGRKSGERHAPGRGGRGR
jgi:TolA-binding protein